MYNRTDHGIVLYMIRKNLINLKFGLLKVERYIGNNTFGQSVWLCKCKCGGKKVVSNSHLRGGLVKSCGCLAKPHGMSRTAFWNVWSSMLKRCRLKSRHDWHRYGGRGIKVLKRWEQFSSFKKDMYCSYLDAEKIYKKVYLDRINNDLGYSKKNCRWVSSKISVENRSTTRWITYKDETDTLTGWAKKLKIATSTFETRIKRHGTKEAIEWKHKPWSRK